MSARHAWFSNPDVWQRYELYTDNEGEIRGVCSTNDNDDDGYPDGAIEQWEVHYRTYGEMLQRTGGMHYGCSGIKVEVYLDGCGVQYDGRRASLPGGSR